jgi:hypothetical protein
MLYGGGAKWGRYPGERAEAESVKRYQARKTKPWLPSHFSGWEMIGPAVSADGKSILEVSEEMADAVAALMDRAYAAGLAEGKRVEAARNVLEASERPRRVLRPDRVAIPSNGD